MDDDRGMSKAGRTRDKLPRNDALALWGKWAHPDVERPAFQPRISQTHIETSINS